VIKKALKIFFAFLIGLVMVLIATVNIRIHYSPNWKIAGRDTINHDLLKELHGLKNALDENADIEMQQIYPEGYVFLNAIYGLAWCNFIAALDQDSEYFKEGQAEINNAWSKIDSDEGRSSFSEDFTLPYGAFYMGWSTYLLGRKLGLELAGRRNEAEVLYFKQQCERIAASVKQSVFLESYHGSAWPADVVLCIAALSLHDKVFDVKYREVIQDWISQVKTRLDPNGLIPHAVNPINGKCIEEARGSSQSLMLIFLEDINQQFAKEQFELYKKNFVDTRFGLTGIREYPKGTFGMGDIDSGPVVFQFGSAATIVGMQTMALYGEQEISVRIRNAVEGFGLPFQNSDRKGYLFGLLPMADAFIAWGHSEDILREQKRPGFAVFHLYSGLIFVLLVLLLWINVKMKGI
jgi:hypothetical protein